MKPRRDYRIIVQVVRYPPITNIETVTRVDEIYDPVRSADIVAGRDERWAEDIKKWRNLRRRP